jgi:hypothetical protein
MTLMPHLVEPHDKRGLDAGLDVDDDSCCDARMRLEEAVGRDLAHRLVWALTTGRGPRVRVSAL